jgi:opacity protein-like surface antigen
MQKLLPIKIGIVCVVLAGIFLLPGYAQNASAARAWGLGTITHFNLPVSNLGDRFSGAPLIGLKWCYHQNEITYDISCIYSKFSSGKIEDQTFQWIYDGLDYPSPQAASEIRFIGVMGNLQRSFKNFGKFSPYWSVGAGFIQFEHQITDLVFPGQSIPPLDYNFIYTPDPENSTSLSLNLGGGIQYFITPQISLALDAKYNVIFGYMRPMEAWLVEKVSPLQLLNVGFGFIYYFAK